MTNENIDAIKFESVLEITEKYSNSIIFFNRWLGAWIDIAGSLSFILVPDYFFGNEFYRSTIGLWLTLAILYFIIPEWFFGQTLGKFLTRTIVVNINGCRPSLIQIISRNFFRIFEVNPILFGGVPAGLVSIMSKHKQRLGDMAANTYVIRKKDLTKLKNG
jgi:uncharacterized RDD family membrane protein YckC